MIRRVVKMTFKETERQNFIKLFEETSSQIRNFEGCLHLELWQDPYDVNCLCTFSHWISEESLNNYRASDLFKDTWQRTKILFDSKPVATSYLPLYIIN